MRKILFIMSFFLVLNSSFAMATNSPVMSISPQQMTTWGTPKTLPVGAKDLVLDGNSSKKRLYTLRLQLPANYKILPFIQNAKTFITVITGSYNVGVGSKFDASKGTHIPAGGFIMIPANLAVFTWTDEPTVIQIHGNGPLNVKLVR